MDICVDICICSLMPLRALVTSYVKLRSADAFHSVPPVTFSQLSVVKAGNTAETPISPGRGLIRSQDACAPNESAAQFCLINLLSDTDRDAMALPVHKHELHAAVAC